MKARWSLSSSCTSPCRRNGSQLVVISTLFSSDPAGLTMADYGTRALELRLRRSGLEDPCSHGLRLKAPSTAFPPNLRYTRAVTPTLYAMRGDLWHFAIPAAQRLAFGDKFCTKCGATVTGSARSPAVPSRRPCSPQGGGSAFKIVLIVVGRDCSASESSASRASATSLIASPRVRTCDRRATT